MIHFTFRAVGTTPLLMHNSRLADPLDPFTKAVAKLTGKQRKTEADHIEIARLEYLGGLYHDEEFGPYLPSDNVFRMLYDAAKKHKQGPSVKEALLITSDVNPLVYAGPRDAETLAVDPNFALRKSAKVGLKRVIRTRPLFQEWAVEAEGMFDDSILDPDRLALFVATAENQIGLGDWRPKYGRFHGEVIVR